MTDKFHLQLLNAEPKIYKEDCNKREFYEKARWIAVGGFFLTPAEIGKKILTRIQEIITHTIELGYGHGDEYFYLEILDEFYEDIHRGYGDYKDTLHNFLNPVKNLVFIYFGVVKGNYNMGYYRECIQACESILYSFDNFLTDINFDMYVRIYSILYLALKKLDDNKAIIVANNIRQKYKEHPLFRNQFDNLRHLCDMSDFNVETMELTEP